MRDEAAALGAWLFSNWPASLTSGGARITHRRTSLWRSCQHSAMAPFICSACLPVLVTLASQSPSRPRRWQMSRQSARPSLTRCSPTPVSRFSCICATARPIGQHRYSVGAKRSNNRGLRTPTVAWFVAGDARPQFPSCRLACWKEFGVGDAVLAVAATVTGGERRLERFRVALPKLASDSQLATGTWAAHVWKFLVGAFAAAALVTGSYYLMSRTGAG